MRLCMNVCDRAVACCVLRVLVRVHGAAGGCVLRVLVLVRVSVGAFVCCTQFLLLS